MAGVIFESWSNPDKFARFESYQDLKDTRERLRALLESCSVVTAHSSLPSFVDSLLANRRERFTTPDVRSASALAEGLRAFGAECVVFDIDDALQCERCNTYTVVRVATEEPDVSVFLCLQCAELKRSCPACGGQGWLRHYRGASPRSDWYLCDECYATWELRIVDAVPRWTGCAEIRLGSPDLLVIDRL